MNTAQNITVTTCVCSSIIVIIDNFPICGITGATESQIVYQEGCINSINRENSISLLFILK